MARLTSGSRKRLPKSAFALPGKRSASGGSGGFPIPDESHARSALQRVSQFGSPAEKATVKRKVRGRYPGMKVGGE